MKVLVEIFPEVLPEEDFGRVSWRTRVRTAVPSEPGNLFNRNQDSRYKYSEIGDALREARHMAKLESSRIKRDMRGYQVKVHPLAFPEKEHRNPSLRSLFARSPRKEVTLQEVRELQEEESRSLCSHLDFAGAKRTIKQSPRRYAHARGLKIEDDDRTRARDELLGELRERGNKAMKKVTKGHKNPIERVDIETIETALGYPVHITKVDDIKWEVSSRVGRKSFQSLNAARAYAKKEAEGFDRIAGKRNPKSDQWIVGTIKRPGALHRKLGVPMGEKIPVTLIREAKAHPERFVKGNAAQVRLEREANEALEFGSFRHRNPEVEIAPAAEELYTDFHGRGPRRIGTYDVPVSIPSSVAELGALLKIKIIGSGRMIQQLAWEPSEGVKLAADPESDSLYIIGDRQRLPQNCLTNLETEFGDAARKNQFIIGTIKELTYRTQKGFDKFETIDYYHELGEETGERPLLVYDRRNHRLLIVGGAYTVKPEGITN